MSDLLLTLKAVFFAWKRRVDEHQIENKDAREIYFFRERILRQGGYIILRAKSFMKDEWSLDFNKSSFVVVPLPNTFMYQMDCTPTSYVFHFPNSLRSTWLQPAYHVYILKGFFSPSVLFYCSSLLLQVKKAISF